MSLSSDSLQHHEDKEAYRIAQGGAGKRIKLSQIRKKELIESVT